MQMFRVHGEEIIQIAPGGDLGAGECVSRCVLMGVQRQLVDLRALCRHGIDLAGMG